MIITRRMPNFFALLFIILLLRLDYLETTMFFSRVLFQQVAHHPV